MVVYVILGDRLHTTLPIDEAVTSKFGACSYVSVGVGMSVAVWPTVSVVVEYTVVGHCVQAVQAVIVATIVVSAFIDSVVASGISSVAILLSVIVIAASPLCVAVELRLISSVSSMAVDCGEEVIAYFVLFCLVVAVSSGLQLSVTIEKTVDVMILIGEQ